MTKNISTDLASDKLQAALASIASMADTLAYLCRVSIHDDKDGHLRVAAAHMADQIGLIADRCNTSGIPVQSVDDWMLPRTQESSNLLS